MSNDFESNSMIKYLIGASRIKYSVLDEIFHGVYLNKHMVTIWVDAHSILYRLYRQKDLSAIYATPREVAIKDLVVSFINVLGHYRRYAATRLHKTNDIVVFFNTELPAYQASVFPGYCESLYSRYSLAHPDFSGVTEIVQAAMEFIGSILRYFEGIYLIDNKGIDDFAAIHYMMQWEIRKDSDHIIFSRNHLPNQLLGPGVYQLYSKRDKSYIITESTAYKNGILKDHKRQASENMTPNFLPFIWMLGGCSDIDMKRSKFTSGPASAVKLLNPLVDQKTLTSDMSVQSFLKELSHHVSGGIELRVSPEKLINRYKAVNVPFASAALTTDQKMRINSSIIDLYDQNSLEEINDMLSAINTDGELLEITNLNMDTVEEDVWL